MVLRITAAGRAALADADNIGINGVRITKVLVGSGQGPGGADDDARTALRNQRDSAVASGSTMVPARVLVRGDIAATAAYSITEIGLEARIGAGEAFLFAYWTDAGEVFAAAVDGVVVLVIAAVDVVAETPAELTVTVTPTVQANFSATFAGLTDTQSGALAANSYYRVRADGMLLVAQTAAQVLADLFNGIASARYVRKSGSGFEALTRGEVAQDLLAAVAAGAYLRRADAGGFEALTRAQVVHDITNGLDDNDFLRINTVGGQRRLEGLTRDQMAALFVVRWELAQETLLQTLNLWVSLGTVALPSGWRVEGAVFVMTGDTGEARILASDDTVVWSTRIVAGSISFRAYSVRFDAPGGDLRIQARRTEIAHQHGQPRVGTDTYLRASAV